MAEVTGPTQSRISNENVIPICGICVTSVCRLLYLIHGNPLSKHPKMYKKQKLRKKIDGDTEK